MKTNLGGGVGWLVQLPSGGGGVQLPPVGEMLSEAAVAASTGIWGPGEVGTLVLLLALPTGLVGKWSGEGGCPG